MLLSYSSKQIITARTTDKTAALIDHVLTNSSHKVSQSGVIDLDFFVHDLIFSTLKTLRPKSQT